MWAKCPAGRDLAPTHSRRLTSNSIMDYSSYASSVSADASSRTAAELSAYMATASAFGLKQGAGIGMSTSGASRSRLIWAVTGTGTGVLLGAGLLVPIAMLFGAGAA